jgi:hypothetical protein
VQISLRRKLKLAFLQIYDTSSRPVVYAGIPKMSLKQVSRFVMSLELNLAVPSKMGSQVF